MIEKQVKPPVFAGFETDYLFALGIPTEWLDAVRQVFRRQPRCADRTSAR